MISGRWSRKRYSRAVCARRLPVAAFFALAMVVAASAPFAPAVSAHSGPCSRIQVELSDRGVSLSSYVVSDPAYVAKRHAEIDQYGQDGELTVSVGELGSVGYAVTYKCLP